MPKIKIILDKVGETLTIHFKEIKGDTICEEFDDGMILMRDINSGETVGFEKLHYKEVTEEPLIIESYTY